MPISKKAPFRPPTDAEIDAAVKRGSEADQSEPRASAIHFDRPTRRFTMTMTNGTTVGFQADVLHELKDFTDDQLAQAEILPRGLGLGWEGMDLHYEVESLIINLFGGEPWRRALRAALSRQLARSGSEARTKASQENGKKGGRPRKAKTA